MTRPTEFSEQNGKAHVPGDPDPYPSSSGSSPNKNNLFKDSNSSEFHKKKSNTKKNRRKHKTQDASDSSSSNSDLFNKSDYRHKRRKKKIHQKTDPIKLCAQLTTKLLTTSHKSKIIRFKLDEDPLQRQVYFLTFVESLEIIFPSIKKLVNYLQIIQKIGGENIK